MTTISPVAEIARENARTTGGQFGVQEHTSPELTLDEYAYPPLVGGLLPSEIDIHFYAHEDGTWRAAASELILADSDEPEPLVPELTVALSEAQSRQFANVDVWMALDEAPVWIRDAVTPSLAVESLHPDASTSIAQWRKGRHDRLVAEGAIATSYDNEYIFEFEDEYPSNTSQDAADALSDLARHEEDGRIYDEDERIDAAAELSRRAAVGVGGVLTDLRQLKVGDKVALSHLVHSDDREDGLYDTLLTVARPDTTGADGDVYIGLEDGGLLCLPIGARVPVLGYEHQGEPRTPTQVVHELVRTGSLPADARRMNPHDAIAQHNATRDERDPSFVRPVTPKP